MIAERSISSRITVWFSSVFFVGLILFGAVMWFHLKDTLVSGRSRTLDRRADRLSELLRDIQQESPELRARRYQAFAEATGGGLIEVFRIDGSLALPSPSLAAGAFPWPTPAAGGEERFREIEFSGQPYLVLARPYTWLSGPVVLCVASSLEGNRPILSTFFEGLLWTIPALLALSALGGYFISRRALRPVDAITEATRSISVSNLSERLPVPPTRDELQRLSETCNAMLARLEAAVNEIQRFTADASHELRSPLSFIRTVAEVALRNRQADAASRGAFEEIVEECGKAGQLLEDMLTLARADSGNARLAFEPVDPAELARKICDKAQTLAAGRRQILSLSQQGNRAQILGDYAVLRRLLWILLENAVKYTPEFGRIQVTVSADDDKVVVSVEDNGIGIPAADLPHIFERFYRVDPSRSQVEGSGLGLAIAQWIAGVHHATLSVESRENTGTTFRVVFPVMTERMDEPAVPEGEVSAVQQAGVSGR